MPSSSEPVRPDSNRFERNRVLDSVLPVALFVGLERAWGLAAGVVGATLWSLKVVVGRYRRGEDLGRYLPILMAYFIVRAVIGIVTDSDAVYFGIGIGTKAAIGVALIVTVLIGKPFLVRYAHLVIPFEQPTRDHPRYGKVMGHLTIGLGCYQFLTSAWDIWLFNQTSTGSYVLIRFLVGWPAGTLASLVALLWADRALRRVPGFSGILDLLAPPDSGKATGGESRDGTQEKKQP
ncbi:MAG: DUF3159 domain-containing protein [Acidimicrobiales bacterium]|nr:DUF3159 domain-containing protein [Acidimicrobiales bacterium]